MVLLPASDLAVILHEVRNIRNDFDSFRKTHGEFAIRTTNEIDELFGKVDARVQARPGRKQACSAKAALGHLLLQNCSVTLI